MKSLLVALISLQVDAAIDFNHLAMVPGSWMSSAAGTTLIDDKNASFDGRLANLGDAAADKCKAAGEKLQHDCDQQNAGLKKKFGPCQCVIATLDDNYKMTGFMVCLYVQKGSFFHYGDQQCIANSQHITITCDQCMGGLCMGAVGWTIFSIGMICCCCCCCCGLCFMCMKKAAGGGGGNSRAVDMEDEHIASSNVGEEFAGCGVYCVFDGHGGKAVSKFCKQHFLQEFVQLTGTLGKPKFGKNKNKKRHCGAHLEPPDMEEILKESFHRMDEMLRDPTFAKELARNVGKVPAGAIEDLQKQLSEMSQKSQKGTATAADQSEMKDICVKLQKLKEAQKGEEFVPDTVGCTAVCVLVRKQDVITANAGDSRAVMCRKGQAVELSYDHKPASETEKTRIEAAGGYLEESAGGARVNGNLNLSRAIGDLEYKKRSDLKPEEQVICSTPDVVVRELTPEDEFIVLACDGVWDVMSNQDICDFIKPRLEKGMDLKEVAADVLEHCCSEDPQKTDGLGTDNMTVIIVKLNESSSWTAS